MIQNDQPMTVTKIAALMTCGDEEEREALLRDCTQAYMKSNRREGGIKGYAEALEAARKERDDKIPRTTTKNGKIVPIAPVKRRTAISAKELDTLDLPDVPMLIDKILPVGLSIIGAPPKSYKSFMMLQVCYNISTGGKFLDFQCNKAATLYLDLESSRRRPRKRLRAMFGDSPKPDNLYILTGTDGVGRLNEGFIEQIEDQLKQHPDIQFIVVDILQLIAAAKKRNQDAYESDYSTFEPLKKLVDKYNIGLMLVHHLSQGKNSEDIFSLLSGSAAKLGAMDCAWIIDKPRDSNEGELHITGRDIAPQDLKVRFNPDTLQWELLGTVADVAKQQEIREYQDSDVITVIKKLIRQGNGYWEGSASEIIEASKYIPPEIYKTPAQAGKEINSFLEMLTNDGIHCEPPPSSCKGKRKYKFADTTDTPNTPDTVDTTATSAQIAMFRPVSGVSGGSSTLSHESVPEKPPNHAGCIRSIRSINTFDDLALTTETPFETPDYNHAILRTIRTLVERDGAWQGSAAALVNAGAGMGIAIEEDVREIGSIIQKSVDLLRERDSICAEIIETDTVKKYAFKRKENRQ